MDDDMSYTWILGMVAAVAFTPQPIGALLGCGCLIMIAIT